MYQHMKCSISKLIQFNKQNTVNYREFAKEIFRGEKMLLKLVDVRQVDIKKYDELSVKNLYDDFMKLEGVNKYFP